MSHIKGPGQAVEQMLQEADTQHMSYLFWQAHFGDPFFRALYAHGMWPGLTIYRKQEDFVECFSFATAREYSLDSRFYNTNIINKLKKFIFYFNTQTYNIVKNYPKKAFGKFEQFKLTPTIQLFDQGESFLRDLNIKRIPLKFHKKELFLTKQEWNCLCCMANGQTIKETAISLKLSPRTVETYLNIVSLKTGGLKKPQMIRLFYNNKDIWS